MSLIFAFMVSHLMMIDEDGERTYKVKEMGLVIVQDGVGDRSFHSHRLT